MYELQAVIGSNDSFRAGTDHLKRRRVVELAGGLSLIPVTDELRAELGASGVGPRTWGFEGLSAGVEDLVVLLSARSPVAYVEAEYFGGVGSQAAAVFESGQLILGPLFEKDVTGKSPISRVLHTLGIHAAVGLDEFDTVGLGRHRSTRGWLVEAPG
jgi:hypothetical protein